MSFAPLQSDTITMLAMHQNTLRHFSIPQSRHDIEVWAMAHHKMGAEVATRVFEAHNEDYVRWKTDRTYLRNWLERLEKIAHEKPLYTLHNWRNLGPYHYHTPITAGRKFVESSIGYMLMIGVWAAKFAKLKGMEYHDPVIHGPSIKRVSLYGMSLTDAEDYGYQKPNALYYIGRLEELGVEVYTPPGCEAFKSCWKSKIYGIGEDIPIEKRSKNLE